MGKIWMKMKGFALTTRDNTDFHRFSNHGTHEIPITIGNGKGQPEGCCFCGEPNLSEMNRIWGRLTYREHIGYI